MSALDPSHTGWKTLSGPNTDALPAGKVTLCISRVLVVFHLTVSPAWMLRLLGSISSTCTAASLLAPSAPAVRVQVLVPLALVVLPALLAALSAARPSLVSWLYCVAPALSSCAWVEAVALLSTVSWPVMPGWIMQTKATTVPFARPLSL